MGWRRGHDARNPYAVMNAQKRKADEARDRAHEPTFAYYVVPRALFEQVRAAGGSFVDLASAADAAGCPVHRMTKRAFGETNTVGSGEAAVYEGSPGVIFIARQEW
jgi:hypothetical protein